MIYLDTSAAAKLVHAEAESEALAVFLLQGDGLLLVSSALLFPELVRVVTRIQPELSARAVRLLQRVMSVAITADIVAGAATVGGPMLRILDAIHLATALSIRQELRSFVSYDKRLSEAAVGCGLPVAAPA